YLSEIDGAETRGRISAAAARQRRGLFTGSLAMADIADCDLIIEAVFEDMGLKREVFAQMDRFSARHAILASNTSSLDLDEIAAATSRPADVVGLHFFSPAHVMSLLEIVRGRATSPDILATALTLARHIGKQPVISGVCDGFIANRIFDQYFREADFLVEEGASPYDVDDALTGFGMPMGPFAVSDLVGLDVGQFIRKRQRAALKPGLRYSTLEDEIVATGRLGRKTGRGWYTYQEGQRTGACDPEVLSIIDRHRLTLGRKARPVSGPEIIERCLFALINEGGKLLDEGIAARASDIDVAAVHGYGFPRYRGGPMKFADTLGLATVAAVVERHFREQGEWWRPSPLLLDLARTGQSLAARRVESVVLP
ncbi:MAG TPA: 3-hydroxyacyl-CoA dehydrogenase NAD-binding domain-containing protein, partial [Nordella sp.]|nr:3-hydroxyacyl-CoA dehydrogenase NAD-binding domain-containing protein [Nordella sp.]